MPAMGGQLQREKGSSSAQPLGRDGKPGHWQSPARKTVFILRGDAEMAGFSGKLRPVAWAQCLNQQRSRDMMADRVTKVDKPPSGAWMVLVACMAFVFLLAALFQVVTGQVEQAGVRQAQYDAAKVAISGCMASYSGAVRRQCIEQVNAGFMPYSAYTPAIEISTDAQAGMPAMPDAQGFQQVAFTPR